LHKKIESKDNAETAFLSHYHSFDTRERAYANAHPLAHENCGTWFDAERIETSPKCFNFKLREWR
jgi:hypothetical protein